MDQTMEKARIKRQLRWRVRRATWVFVVLYLLTAAVSYPLAFTAMGTRLESRGMSPQVMLNDAKAAAKGWPSPTPHDIAWPSPSMYAVEKRPGVTVTDARGSEKGDRQTSHQMQHEEYGWPVAVMSRTQYWWPQGDPKWATTAKRDTGLRVEWVGMALTPAIPAAVVTGIWCVPALVKIWTRARRRRRGGVCENCGSVDSGAVFCARCGEVLSAE